MIKGYGIDINTNNKEVDEDFLVNVIGDALKLKGIDLIGLGWQANWKNMSDYEHDIKCE